MAGAREPSCFGGLKLTSRGKRKRSEPLYFDVQIHGSSPWCVLASCAVNSKFLDMWLVSGLLCESLFLDARMVFPESIAKGSSGKSLEH